jgi:GNAT superfamily N-acetyltransferase
MSQRYTIKLAARHHVRSVPAIEQAAAAVFSEDDLPPGVRYLVTDSEILVDAQRDRRLWAALDDQGQVVGFALACTVGGNAHLEEMDVHPDHGRRGIGSRLLQAVLGWARAGRFPGMTLITFRHLPWNAPFYERRGFVRLDYRDTSNHLRELILEEADAGLEPGKRVAMLRDFNADTGLAGFRPPA